MFKICINLVSLFLRGKYVNQEKIGKFIALNRRKKNLTQEKLAEKLHISKNAVSKWERELNMPDVSIMKSLCSILGISLNELFAGEYLDEKSIRQKSEENIINLASSEDKKRKNLKIIIILLNIVLLIFIISLIIFIKVEWTSANVIEINWNIDIPREFIEEYYTDSGPSFHGDGKRYTVFKGTNFNKGFSDKKNTKLEREISKLNISLKIEASERIDFKHNYEWKKIVDKDDKRNALYIIYDSDIDKYYFYEDIA